jgi:hypothetical protein
MQWKKHFMMREKGADLGAGLKKKTQSSRIRALATLRKERLVVPMSFLTDYMMETAVAIMLSPLLRLRKTFSRRMQRKAGLRQSILEIRRASLKLCKLKFCIMAQFKNAQIGHI